MSDKEKNVASSNEEKIEASLNKTEEYNEEQLHDELERLADTFRTELQKAKEQGAELTEEQIEAIEEKAIGNGISKDELCECCGERKKDTSISENYPYCSECRELMKKYPISVASIVIAVVVIFIAMVSAANFVTDFSGYNKARLAKDADSENKKFSAVEYYDEAISFFNEKEIVPKKLLKDSAYNVFSTLPKGVASLKDTSDRLDKALSDFEAKLPIYAGFKDLRDTALTMYKSFNAFYALLEEVDFDSFDTESREQVTDLYNKIGALVNKEDTIKNMDGSGNVTITYDKASILFAQFMFSYSYGQYDLAYDALTALNEIAPEYVAMYGYELAIIEIQYGNYKKATTLADTILLNNAEDSSAYIIYAYNNRMKGKLDKAISYAEKGIALEEKNPDLYRQKAIALMLKGDYQSAIGVLDTALSYEKYNVLYYTYLVAATELGDERALEKINNEIKTLEGETPARVQEYLDGKLTVEELFMEGTGDVEWHIYTFLQE